MYGPGFEENLALIQTMFGANSQAISTLTQLLQTPYYSWFYSQTPVTPALLSLDPLWDPLRGDPRFEQIVASVHRDPLTKSAWITDLLGVGDIDRIIIEWRSLLRQISNAPSLAWPRWQALQAMAKGILHETESPTLTELPPLDYHQTRRIEHSLILRRH